MSRDLFDILGLPHRPHEEPAVRERFIRRRDELRRRLSQARSPETQGELDALHVAYTVLRDPQTQTVYLRRHDETSRPNRVELLRTLIAGSLEDGLLRHSRREKILAEGRRLGLSPFHTQLLIAQTQFGPQRVLPFDDPQTAEQWGHSKPGAARLAAALVLALALFLAAVRLIGI
ncbi:MAG: hypothetical protein HZB38_03650 [Planctomycetes bacterium]|nr:hypothetical protein [Planctomycetota bacterium]